MIPFSKMQATGNDFVVVDARAMSRAWMAVAPAVCHRRLGIGADGLILLLPSQAADYRMRIFNADGSEAEMCGNGLRCFAKYVVDRGLTPPGRGELSVETPAGVRKVRPFLKAGKVVAAQVQMGKPMLKAKDIPAMVREDEVDITPILDYIVVVERRELPLTLISMGNPHAVCFLEEPVAQFPLDRIGPQVEHHPLFPRRTNFEVARILDRGRIAARVWERGVGETLSCGSGACAIAVAACLHGSVEEKVDIEMPGGELTIEWDGEGEVLLTGPVQEVFTGQWLEARPE